MIRIGLTGAIATGKTKICSLFAEHFDAEIFDCDSMVKILMVTDDDIITKVKETFGEESYNGFNLNLKYFNQNLWDKPEMIEKMNRIVEPATLSYLNKFFNKYRHRKYIIVESAVLFKTDLYKNVDKTILVHSDINQRIERLKTRYKNDIVLINKKINCQSFDGIETDFIINNSGEDLMEQLKMIDNQLDSSTHSS